MESKKPNKVVFLDRDGVINKDTHYLYKISDFQFQPGIINICLYLLKLDYQLIVTTNQSGIARGYYNEKDFFKLNNWMIAELAQQGVKILDVFFCPHAPGANCSCRKPKPGMLIDASNKHNISLENSWMIGDRNTDIKAANAAGVNNTILLSSHNNMEAYATGFNHTISSISYVKNIITK